MINKWYSLYRDNFRKTAVIALPIIGSELGQIVVSQVDTIMIGHLGSSELAAAALGNAIFIPIMIFGYGITTSIAAFVSESIGAKNHQNASSYLKHGLVVSLLFGTILASFMIFVTPLIKYMNQPEEVVKLAIPYIKIIALSLIPLMAFFAIRQFGGGLFETKPELFTTLFGNIINLGFNFLLIYGMFGFPKLGIEGAGYATLIARTCMPLIILYFYFKKSHVWRLIKNIKWKIYNKDKFYRILNFGIPSAFIVFFEVAAFRFATFIVGLVGVNALAAHQISISISLITSLICVGFSVATTVRIGNRLGEKDFIGLRRVGFSSIITIVGFMFVCSVLFVIFNEHLSMIYTREPQVIEIAKSLIIVAAFFQISDGVQIVSVGALRGMQDTKIPTLISFISYWVLALPIGYWLCFFMGFGTVGIWIGLLIGLTVSAILLFWRLHLKTKLLLKNHE